MISALAGVLVVGERACRPRVVLARRFLDRLAGRRIDGAVAVVAVTRAGHPIAFTIGRGVGVEPVGAPQCLVAVPGNGGRGLLLVLRLPFEFVGAALLHLRFGPGPLRLGRRRLGALLSLDNGAVV